MADSAVEKKETVTPVVEKEAEKPVVEKVQEEEKQAENGDTKENGDAKENGEKVEEEEETKKETENGDATEDHEACPVKRKSAGGDAPEGTPAEGASPEKKAKLDEKPAAEAEANGAADAAKVAA